ncbi:hypothetical protein ABZS66_36300 [Dactylosporangium sp. NPDC005572]|uniref:hypothetical protein n=1 Tax=Dactylosporangium sp. NPDC005572 TaxID=3156889 RepID=UPI0033BA49D2
MSVYTVPGKYIQRGDEIDGRLVIQAIKENGRGIVTCLMSDGTEVRFPLDAQVAVVNNTSRAVVEFAPVQPATVDPVPSTRDRFKVRSARQRAKAAEMEAVGYEYDPSARYKTA